MEFLLGTDLITFTQTIGLLGIFLTIFAESGLFIGLFLPGDSLLFTAGFLASQGYLDIFWLMILSFLGAVLGDNVGYFFGKKIGPKIFTREDSFFFHREHLERAQDFYKKHGGKTLVLARFMPVIRTLAPILAGVGRMYYATFFFYNVLGGMIWGVGITALGYWLGNVIPNIDKYIVPLVIAIILTSLLPGIFQILQSRERRKGAWRVIARFFRKSNDGSR